MDEVQKMYHDQTKEITKEKVIMKIHMTLRPISEKGGLADAWCNTHGEDKDVRAAAGHTQEHVSTLYHREYNEEKKALMEGVIEKMNGLANTAFNVWGYEMAPIELTSEHTHLGRAIQYSDGKHEIKINNRKLWEYGNGYINLTIPHEFAHLIVYRMQKDHGVEYAGHGRVFNEVCSVFGIKGGAFYTPEELRAAA